jgi:hypothetical protein
MQSNSQQPHDTFLSADGVFHAQPSVPRRSSTTNCCVSVSFCNMWTWRCIDLHINTKQCQSDWNCHMYANVL